MASLTITPDTIITVLQYAMEAVEITTLTGDEKKTAVMEIVKKAVIDAPMDTDVENILLEMIEDGIVSHIIDIIVSASRGELNLKRVASASQVVCTNIVPHLGTCIFHLGRCMTSCFVKKKRT
eukprot:7390279-Prymnesium_polylepis.2